MEDVRNPVVAGAFYPGTKESLRKTVEALVGKPPVRKSVLGAVSPHAGYVYSGAVAACVLSSIEPRPVYIIVGPNHTGLGPALSLSRSDSWMTPLGKVSLDGKLREAIMTGSSVIEADNTAHEAEHSIEAQLPILQVLQKEFKFIPIVVGSDDIEVYETAAKDIAGAVKSLGMEKDVVIIASSDMTHYETDASARRKDKAAIKSILELDERKFIALVRDMDVSMCGYGPVAIMLSAVKLLGATRAELVKYQTSGDASGDYSSVVGYAGITVS